MSRRVGSRLPADIWWGPSVRQIPLHPFLSLTICLLRKLDIWPVELPISRALQTAHQEPCSSVSCAFQTGSCIQTPHQTRGQSHLVSFCQEDKVWACLCSRLHPLLYDAARSVNSLRVAQMVIFEFFPFSFIYSPDHFYKSKLPINSMVTSSEFTEERQYIWFFLFTSFSHKWIYSCHLPKVPNLFFKEHYVLIDFNVLVFDEFHFLVVIILDEAHIAPTFGQ